MDLEYIYSQTNLLCVLAFMFGPMLPVLFIYGFIGFLINDIIVRIRIAYTIRRFPKYDDSLNQLYTISSSVIFYAFTSITIYSNDQIFWNKVNYNDSASSYNAAYKFVGF